ncbi:hypothetical protein FA13DRAFT_1727323 [Coprinellus micaceus]|uniref:Uncharacterized protein n=1 Tax=Coprinellus micaceus TaxID=71717 RepID=A0A4Y7TSX6_COPMI|nr:hypothetical protein FA13DRAFT_1727323 [Coprinellus micaceus]
MSKSRDPAPRKASCPAQHCRSVTQQPCGEQVAHIRLLIDPHNGSQLSSVLCSALSLGPSRIESTLQGLSLPVPVPNRFGASLSPPG